VGTAVFVGAAVSVLVGMGVIVGKWVAEGRIVTNGSTVALGVKVDKAAGVAVSVISSRNMAGAVPSAVGWPAGESAATAVAEPSSPKKNALTAANASSTKKSIPAQPIISTPPRVCSTWLSIVEGIRARQDV
jgi:hypothetical protein